MSNHIIFILFFFIDKMTSRIWQHKMGLALEINKCLCVDHVRIPWMSLINLRGIKAL